MFIVSVKDRARLRAAAESGILGCSGVERDISLTLLALLNDLEVSERARRNQAETDAERPDRRTVQSFDMMPEERLAEIEKRYAEIVEKLNRRNPSLEDLHDFIALMHRLPALAREVRCLKLRVGALLLDAAAPPARQ